MGSRSLLSLLIIFAHIGYLEASEAPFRLPGDIVPLHYRLDLKIVPDQPTFSGNIEIDVRIQEPVEEIWLHGRDLVVDNVQLVTATHDILSGRYEQVTDDGMARLTFAVPIESQNATLRFSYSADFGSSLNGLYSVAVDDDSYAFTQFESIYARKAFPSFDEPAYKATFDISITTRDSYEAFTNTHDLSTQKLSDEMKRITYARTLPLPTYLIAFAVGALDVVE